MAAPWKMQKSKNKQWRIIIWCSLFLIFGKELGYLVYHGLGLNRTYTAIMNMANQVGMRNMLPQQLIIEIRNDTPSEYTLDTKIYSGQLFFANAAFHAGDIKRFMIKADNSFKGIGDILFLSSPMTGDHNTTCREIHTLNYDLKYADQIKQPFVVNLSSIASRIECK
jgi:hypothetical protein